MVRMTKVSEGSHTELLITSAYLQYDSAEPPHTKELRCINYYSRRRQYITEYDSNANHIKQSSTGTNPVGSLMEYLVSLNMNVHDIKNKTKVTIFAWNCDSGTDLSTSKTPVPVRA
jgi:hypothetical protein